MKLRIQTSRTRPGVALVTIVIVISALSMSQHWSLVRAGSARTPSNSAPLEQITTYENVGSPRYEDVVPGLARRCIQVQRCRTMEALGLDQGDHNIEFAVRTPEEWSDPTGVELTDIDGHPLEIGGVTVVFSRDRCSGDCAVDTLHPAPRGSRWIQFTSNRVPLASEVGTLDFKTIVTWSRDDGVTPDGAPMATWLSNNSDELYDASVTDAFGEGVWRSARAGVECVSLAMEADASVSSLQSRANFGSEQMLLVGRSAGEAMPTATRDPEEPTATPVPREEVWQALLRSEIQDACTPFCTGLFGHPIISATLSIFMVDSTGRAKDVEACPIEGEWFEPGLSWDNRPRADESACRTWSMGSSAGRYELDVTDEVRDFVQGDRDLNGWLLRAMDPRDEWLRIFRSREWRNEDEQPRLTVCVEPDLPIEPTPDAPPSFPDPPDHDPETWIPAAKLNPPTFCGAMEHHPPLLDLTAGAGGCSPCCSGGPTAAEPGDTGLRWGSGVGVHLHSGEAYVQDVDLEIPGRGLDYQLGRRYSSAIRYDGLIGANWSTTYARRLIVRQGQAGNGDVTLVDGFGRADVYALNEDGSFDPPTGYFTSLRREDDGRYVERDPQGTTVVYGVPDAQGLAPMVSLSDRHGNTLRFEHDGTGRLVRVMDTLGRPIDYHYDAQGRIASVEDFAGRIVRYGYDEAGNLSTVTSPTIAGTPNGNDFPNGRTWRYSYRSDSGDSRMDHNLVAVTAPNEVAAGGPPMLQLDYDDQDRLLSMSIGGTNASGVPAGGTVRYQYSTLEPAGEVDVNTPVRETLVEDRNGNRTRYQMNSLGNIVAKIEETNRDIRPQDPDQFTTRYEYSAEGHLLRTTQPEGDWSETHFDLDNPDRLQQGNILRQTVYADPDRGGSQARLTTSYRFEPVYGQVHALTDARGHDEDYRPAVGLPGETHPNPDRYTTIYTYDFQEGEDYAALGRARGLGPGQMQAMLVAANIPMGLGDVNGDGRIDGVAGDLIRIEHPSVHLADGSNMLALDDDAVQERIERLAYNDHGQRLWHEDAEGQITRYFYHPANDPDGDGEDRAPGMSEEPAGYLASVIRDAGATTPPPTDHPKIYLPYASSQSVGGYLALAQRLMGVLRPGWSQPQDRLQGLFQSPDDPAIGHANITTRYTYDPVGHLERVVDPRGVATDYTVNAVGEVLQILRAADVSGALDNSEEPGWSRCEDVSLPECSAGMVPFGYRTILAYDANGNLIRSEVENRDTIDDARLGAFVETRFVHDILGQLVELRQEVSENPAEEVVTRYRYDANGNQVLVLRPQANLAEDDPEAQPSNLKSLVFDERDQVHSVTRGGFTAQFQALAAHAGIAERTGIPNSPDRATETHRYDANGNRVALTDAADNSGDGQPETSLTLYDGFNRPVSRIDALGGQSLVEYDPTSQIVARSDYGPTGGASPIDNSAATASGPMDRSHMTQPLLARFEVDYDEAGRLVARRDMLFAYEDVNLQRPPRLAEGPGDLPDDGWIEAHYEYDRAGRLRYFLEDDGDRSMIEYDHADRPIRMVDAEGNERLTDYDDAGNAIRVTQVERSRAAEVIAGSVPAIENRYTRFVIYDALGRVIRVSDDLGQSIRSRYDSHGQVVASSDAKFSGRAADLIPDPLGLLPADVRLNRPGNRSTTEYDGLGRALRQVTELHRDGQASTPLDDENPANPDGKITLETQWDANGRLLRQSDDSGQITEYAYDALDRMVRRRLADGTVYAAVYDADDNLTQTRDPNGSIGRVEVDGLGRWTALHVQSADGVVGTAELRWQYDGLGRLRLAVDENDPSTETDDVSDVRVFDSLGRLLEEQQGGLAVSSRWSGDGRRIELVYPDGRTFQFGYDGLDVLDTVTDLGSGVQELLVDYDRMGPGRLIERRMANGTVWTALDSTRRQSIGYDAIGRPVELRHLDSQGALLVGSRYGYDRNDAPRFEDKLHDPGNGEVHLQDSIGRLVEFLRGSIEPDGSGVAAPATDALARQTWHLDGAGDWQATTRWQDDQEQTEARTHSATHALTMAGSQNFNYDANGNLLQDGTRRYRWDAMNRLRSVERIEDGAEIARFTYDGMGRRVGKRVAGSEGQVEVTRYVHDGHQEIEERSADGRLRRRSVFGSWIDEALLVEFDRDEDSEISSEAGERLFLHANAQGSTMAVSDEGGRLVEGYRYDPYGRPAVFEAGANGVIDWGDDDRIGDPMVGAMGNPWLYTGRRYEPELEMYHYRARYLDPKLGRFISQDPLGPWGTGNLGNAYAYVANAPHAKVDPLGLKEVQAWESGVQVQGVGKIGPGGAAGGPEIGYGIYIQSAASDTAEAVVWNLSLPTLPAGGLQYSVGGAPSPGQSGGHPIQAASLPTLPAGGLQYSIGGGFPPGGVSWVHLPRAAGLGKGFRTDLPGQDWVHLPRTTSLAAAGLPVPQLPLSAHESLAPGGPQPKIPCPPYFPLPPNISIDEEGVSTKFIGPTGLGGGSVIAPMKMTCTLVAAKVQFCESENALCVCVEEGGAWGCGCVLKNTL